MSKKLFQEILEFKRYGNCLDEDLHEEYKYFLAKKVLNEITAKNLADIFKRNVFSKKEIDSLDATIDVSNRYAAILQNLKYERKSENGKLKIKPNEYTHLEKEPKKYCTKEIFRQEFKKEKFKDSSDLKADSLANSLLDRYLENFDDQGWLILKRDDYEATKHVQIPDLIF